MSRIFNEINTRSDFVIVLAMDGGIPSCDFDGRVISGYTQYPFGRKSSEYTHCMERVPPHEEGTTANQELLILCDRHGLASGTVTVEIAWHIPDPLFPDGYRDELRRYDPHIRLSATASGDVDMVRVEAQLPLYKGDKGDKGDKLTYADLTVQDKEDLIGPIKDDLDKAMTDKADKTELSNIVGVPSDGNIEDLDPTFITTALRKTAQVLTLEEQAQVKANLGISKMELFIDMWNAAVENNGCYNGATGYFELNGITNIDYAEALRILDVSKWPKINAGGPYLSNQKLNIRTALPLKTQLSGDYSLLCFAQNCETIEVIKIIQGPYVYCSDLGAAFNSCYRLRSIVGTITLSSGTKGLDSAFGLCRVLEDVRLSKLSRSIRFGQSPLLSFDSIDYMIKNAANTASITVTVHPDVYAKLTDEANTEWYALMTEAADKNIIFATV